MSDVDHKLRFDRRLMIGELVEEVPYPGRTCLHYRHGIHTMCKLGTENAHRPAKRARISSAREFLNRYRQDKIQSRTVTTF